MIRGRFLKSGDDMTDIFAIRRQVFVDELGLEPETAKDELDSMAFYALVMDEHDVPSGTGRLALDDDRFMLGRICVLKSARGQKLGDLILRMLLVRVEEMDAPAVFVKALLPAVKFYQRYGFKVVSEEFDEEGAAHVLMRALKDEIDIEGDCQKQNRG